MQIDVSISPAERAATNLNELLGTHNEQDILLLLSGGSALSVLAYIDEFVLGPNVTAMMADERFSTHPDVNNFSQLRESAFYEAAQRRNVRFIETVPDTLQDTPESFAIGIEKMLHYYFKIHQRPYVLSLLGIGEDGHFASVFPNTERTLFEQTYHTNKLYIEVHEPANEHPNRTTITPYFIKRYVDDVLLYATTRDKCDTVLQTLIDNDVNEHELPARIPARHPHSVLFTDCKNLAP